MKTQKFGQKLQANSRAFLASSVLGLYSHFGLNLASVLTAIPVTTTLAFLGAAQAAVLQDWKLDPTTGKVEVLLPRGATPRVSVVSLPPRVILDLPNTEVGVTVTERYETGIIRQASLSQFQPQLARLVVEFSPGVVLDAEDVELRQVGIENLWVLRPTLLQREEPPQTNIATAQPAVTPTPTPTPTLTPQTNAVQPANSPMRQPASQPLQTPPAGQTVLPNPQPSREPSVDLVRVPVGQPQDVRFFPETEMMPPPPPAYGQQQGVELVPYGQQLPSPPTSTAAIRQSDFINQRPPTVLLARGTRLTLQYPNLNDVRLRSRFERQEVLLLQGGIVDNTGNFIVPPDTPVVGRFETSTRGSRFIAQAINLNGRSIPIQGQSDWIPGSREVKAENILLDSGIGGVGGFLVSGFSGIGLIAGVVGGAAIGYVTSPQPTTLEPGQLVEIQLTQDLPTNFVLTSVN